MRHRSNGFECGISETIVKEVKVGSNNDHPHMLIVNLHSVLNKIKTTLLLLEIIVS